MRPERDFRQAIEQRRDQEERCRIVAQGLYGKQPSQLDDVENFWVRLQHETAMLYPPEPFIPPGWLNESIIWMEEDEDDDRMSGPSDINP